MARDTAWLARSFKAARYVALAQQTFGVPTIWLAVEKTNYHSNDPFGCQLSYLPAGPWNYLYSSEWTLGRFWFRARDSTFLKHHFTKIGCAHIWAKNKVRSIQDLLRFYAKQTGFHREAKTPHSICVWSIVGHLPRERPQKPHNHHRPHQVFDAQLRSSWLFARVLVSRRTIWRGKLLLPHKLHSPQKWPSRCEARITEVANWRMLYRNPKTCRPFYPFFTRKNNRFGRINKTWKPASSDQDKCQIPITRGISELAAFFSVQPFLQLRGRLISATNGSKINRVTHRQYDPSNPARHHLQPRQEFWAPQVYRQMPEWHWTFPRQYVSRPVLDLAPKHLCG